MSDQLITVGQALSDAKTDTIIADVSNPHATRQRSKAGPHEDA